MNKSGQLFPSYEYLDSQRLKDTFFSSTPKKKKKPIILSVISTIFLSILAFFLINYSFIIIPRKNTDRNELSLIRTKNLSSVYPLEKRSSLTGFTQKGHFIHLNIVGQEKNGIKINLKKPINLNDNHLYLYLKKSSMPLKLCLVVKDIYYHSNSLYPLTLDIPQTQDALTKIPIFFENNPLPNTNLSKISQINITFSSQNYDEKIWALISDLVLVKK